MTDSEKAAALVGNPGLQDRIMYLIWRHALFAWNTNAPDKQIKLDAAKALQADSAKLAMITRLVLTAPGIIGIMDPANGGIEVDDNLLLGQIEQNLVFWAQSVLGIS